MLVERIVVVGAGLAGLRSAQELRSQGYRGHLTLVGAETARPYDRPPLSKAVLRGELSDTTLPADWDTLDVELLLGVRAEALGDGVVETTTGRLGFDGLVVASGASPLRLPGPGPQRVLRTLGDALTLRATLRPGRRVAVVGAGWIGAEVACAAAAAGCRVTVVEAGPAPLAQAVGGQVGAWTVPWYAAAGVELRLGVKVAAVEPGGIALADGGFLAADEVVVGVGVRPEVGWLAGSGVAVEDGVAVDAALRSSRPEIVAVGDCAAFWSSRYDSRLRVEHWDNALRAPQVAASTLLGRPATYDPVPYFWSEQFGHMLQYAGYHPAGDVVVRRADSRSFTAFWLAGDRLVALLAVDRPRDLLQGRRVIAAAHPVDVERLVDPRVAVRDALAERTER